MTEKPDRSLTNNLKAVTKTRLHEQIVFQIQSLIDKGRLKHGDQLPPERELATIFKVSRHSVREAIRIMEQKKVLKSRPGSGTYIILEDEPSVVEFLARAIDREKHTLGEIFQFRELLEPQIAGLAAQNATEADLSILQDILEQQQNELDDSTLSKDLDHDFHRALAKATGNSVLLQVIELLDHIFLKSRHAYSQSPHRNRLSIQGHQEIIKAVKKGDPTTAKELMADHLKAIKKLVISSSDHQTE
ncbi:MAG: FadR family transcriptional regulator [Deltaproteobacteria bacterium]|nr:FadR family transcriptional regulator [Deltaproteobacteria bacterium]